jgi:hypothetical protein
MSEDHTDELEAILTAALERAPKISVPSDFAARVVARVSRERTFVLRPVTATRVGLRMAVGVAVGLLPVLLLLATRARTGVAVEWLEVGLAFEFAGLWTWLGLRTLWVQGD